MLENNNKKWVEYVHIKKIDNNRMGEKINSFNFFSKNSCLMHVNHKNNIKCPPAPLPRIETRFRVIE
jgi:hypothetical protein